MMGSVRKLTVYVFTLIFFILNSAFIAHAENAETKTDKHLFEFSAAASIGLRARPIDNPITFSAPLRIGIFIKKNIGLESEIIFALYDKNVVKKNPFFMVNIAYTKFDTASQIKPFFLLGAGFIRLPPEGWIAEAGLPPEVYLPDSYLVGDAGGGIKWFSGKNMALRAEYRFIIYGYQREKVIHHKIFLGISFFI